MPLSDRAAEHFAFSYDDMLAAAERDQYPAFHSRGRLTLDALSLLKGVFDDCSAADLAGVGLDDLLADLHEFWADTAQLDPNIGPFSMVVAPLQTANGDTPARTVLSVCGPDHAFLVSTLVTIVAGLGHDVLALFHPIITVARDDLGTRLDDGPERAEVFLQMHVPSLSEEDAHTLETAVAASLELLTTVNDDFAAMRDALRARLQEEGRTRRFGLSREETDEALAFLRWLLDGNFAFFGVREQSARGAFAPKALGISRDIADFGVTWLHGLTFTKSRREVALRDGGLADVILIPHIGPDGMLESWIELIGQMGAAAQDLALADVPWLRRRARIIADLARGSTEVHDQGLVARVLETAVRHEVFALAEDELLGHVLAVAHLAERPRPQVLFREDLANKLVFLQAFLPSQRSSNAWPRFVSFLEQELGLGARSVDNAHQFGMLTRFDGWFQPAEPLPDEIESILAAVWAQLAGQAPPAPQMLSQMSLAPEPEPDQPLSGGPTARSHAQALTLRIQRLRRLTNDDEMLAREAAIFCAQSLDAALGDLAMRQGLAVEDVVLVGHVVASRFGFDTLRMVARSLPVTTGWDSLATQRLSDDVRRLHLNYVEWMLGYLPRLEGVSESLFDPDFLNDRNELVLPAFEAVNGLIGEIAAGRQGGIKEAEDAIADLSRTADWTLAKLVIAVAHLRDALG